MLEVASDFNKKFRCCQVFFYAIRVRQFPSLEDVESPRLCVGVSAELPDGVGVEGPVIGTEGLAKVGIEVCKEKLFL